MRILFVAASLVLGLSGAAPAIEMTKPFEVLEETRRFRIELDKRLAQDKAKQLQAAREEKAKQFRSERKRKINETAEGSGEEGRGACKARSR